MGIKKVKIPDLVLEPTSSTELGLAGLLSLKRNKNSDEVSEDLSFLESKSATVAFNKKTLFSVKQLIKDSVDSISLVPKDLKYDDSSIPEAPNFLEWCEGSEFLKATPYLEQALAGLLLYGEICPHCSDMEWVKDIDQHDPAHGTSAIRKRCSILHNGRCYKCGRTRSEMIDAGDINFYNELILLWGQRSGKSEETAMLCTYQTHRVLKMQNPARVYGIGDNQVLQGTFVALTQGQASENLWTPFYGYLLGAPWFRKYHELMAMYDAKYGQELIKVRDTYVLYRHRNLLIYPAGPDKRVLRGRTRVFAAIDELGWFDNGGVEAAKKVKTSAKEVYTALSNSLQTVRAEERRLVASNMHTALTGYMYCISSPSSIRDKICELYKLSQGSKKMLGLHAPTWKINPKFTREVLDEEFRKDPVSAERDFGANPPLSSSPFIGDFSLVADARKEVGRNCVNYSHQTYTATDANRSKTRFASIAGIKESGYPSVMAIDAGETNNSFSITTMSKHNGIHSIDCLIEIMPLPGIPLNYTLIFDKIILPIVKARNVRVIVSDRWNSTKILQDLYHTLTIDMYQKYSLKYADFWNFKTLLEQRAIKIPRSVILNSVEDLRAMDVSNYPRCFEGRPVEHFMFQIITVQDTGRQVVKGPDMTDDLWRAVVLGSWALDNLDFKDFLSEKAVKTINRDPSRLAVSRGSSMGGTRISAGSSQVGKTGAVIKQRGGYNGY